MFGNNCFKCELVASKYHPAIYPKQSTTKCFAKYNLANARNNFSLF